MEMLSIEEGLKTSNIKSLYFVLPNSNYDALSYKKHWLFKILKIIMLYFKNFLILLFYNYLSFYLIEIFLKKVW